MEIISIIAALVAKYGNLLFPLKESVVLHTLYNLHFQPEK